MWKKDGDTYIQNVFGTRLLIVLKQRHMFQRELAEMVEIGENAIGRYIRGERLPSMPYAKRIAEALGVSLDWMIGLNENADNVINDAEDLPLNG